MELDGDSYGTSAGLAVIDRSVFVEKRGDSLAKPKPELIIHIGSLKTGSTSIQRALGDNRKFLRQEGILYSYGLTGRNFESGHLLPGRKLNQLLDDKLMANILKVDVQHRFVPDTSIEGFVNDILAEYSKCGCNKMILSEELLFEHIPHIRFSKCIIKEISEKQLNELMDKTIQYKAKKLKALFDGFSVKIVCYVRRQDLLIESLYNQLSKSGSIKRELELVSAHQELFVRWTNYDFEENEKLQDFDLLYMGQFANLYYYDILNVWADVFGKENVIVKPFEKGQMKSGLVKDFFVEILGIDPERLNNLKDYHVNERISRDVVEYVNGLKERPSYLEPTHLVEISEKLGNVNKYQAFLSPEERIRLLERHREGNEKIAREYLGREDGILFYDRVNTDDYEPYPGLSDEKRAIIEAEVKRLDRGSDFKNKVSAVFSSTKPRAETLALDRCNNRFVMPIVIYGLTIYGVLRRGARFVLKNTRREE